MAIQYSWKPKSITPLHPNQIFILKWDNSPVTLSTPVEIESDGSIKVVFDVEGKYKILVKNEMGKEFQIVSANDPHEDGPLYTVLSSTGQEVRPKTPHSVAWLGGTSRPINMRIGDIWFSLAGSSSGDSIPPGIPSNLNFSSITDTGFTVTWTAPSDNIGVTAYEVYLDDVLKTTVAGTQAVISDLVADMAYSVAVRARDAAGNWGSPATGVATTGSAISGPIIHNVFGNTDYPRVLTKQTESPITVASNFYTVLSTPAGWRVRGARLFVPVGISLPSSGIFSFWAGATQATPTSPDLTQEPTREVVFDSLGTGWNNVYFAVPYDLTPGEMLWIGYRLGDGTQYLAAPSSGEDFVYSENTTKLVEAEKTARSHFLYDGGTTGHSDGHFGIDIIIDEGAV